MAVYKVALFCCEIYSNTSVYSSPFFYFYSFPTSPPTLGHCSTFLSHCDETIWPAPETISHRIHRSRRLGGLTDDGHVPLLPEFAHVARPPATRSCVPTACPAFLINYQPRAGALPRPLECSSRMAEYQRRDHERLWAGHNSRSGKELLLHGRTKEEEVEERELHYNPVQDKGLTAAR